MSIQAILNFLCLYFLTVQTKEMEGMKLSRQPPHYAYSVSSMLQANMIVLDAMNLFWNPELLEQTLKKYNLSSLQGKNIVIERLFQKALQISPERLDFMYGIAFFQILQGKVKEAVKIYEDLFQIYSPAFEAGVMDAVFTKFAYGKQQFEQKIDRLKQINAQKVKELLKFIYLADQIIENKQLPKDMLTVIPEAHCIVICGVELSYDGKMDIRLIRRLEKGMQLYRSNKGSKIIVTGGNPKAGRTESFMMMYWLVDKGIPKHDIIQEDQSRDTVQNAFNIVQFVQKYGFRSVTVTTDAAHAYRAYAIFQTIRQQANLDVYLVIAAVGSKVTQIPEEEKLAILRDIVRACGYWALPGIFR